MVQLESQLVWRWPLSLQCRSAALAVLYTMLEGSRPYLAAADDHSHSAGMAFTPFSVQLGGVLREMHHCLVLSLGIEAQSVVLTRAVRCLAMLAGNTPYHQLSSGHTSRILSALQPLSHHRGIYVCVCAMDNTSLSSQILMSVWHA